MPANPRLQAIEAYWACSRIGALLRLLGEGKMKRLRCLFTMLVACVAASNAHAQIEKHLGMLGQAVELGTEAPWDARLQDGWFNLFNNSVPDAVRYYSISPEPVDNGERTVKVNLMVLSDAGEASQAGILFEQKAGNDYSAFTIGADKSVNLILRKPDGLQREIAEGLQARLDGSDVLTVRHDSRAVKLLLNGTEAFSIDLLAPLQEAYGIIAFGQGRFAFNGWDLATLGGGSNFPSPNDPASEEESPFPSPKGAENDAEPTPQAPEPAADPFAGMSDEDIYASQIMLGVTFGIFFHELGHAVIGETNLPATGPEEDVADGFSAFTMTNMVEDGDYNSPQEALFVQKMTEFASLFWYYSAINSDQSGQQHPWQDEHSPDIKRFRNSFCIVYGSNPQRYTELADKIGFEQRTRERCKVEYIKRDNAWDAILKTVSRDRGPDLPGDHHPDTPGGKIILTFHPASTQVGQFIKAVMGDSGQMRSMLDEIQHLLVLPRDLYVDFGDCEIPNAWYDPSEGRVTMCYQATEHFSKLVVQMEGGQGQGQGQGQTGTNEAAAFMVGVWQTKVPSTGGAAVMLVEYAQNGQFQYHAESMQGSMDIVGTWKAEMNGNNSILVTSQPQQQQVCDTNNNCQPTQVQQGAQQVVVQVQDQNTVTASGITWQRMQ